MFKFQKLLGLAFLIVLFAYNVASMSTMGVSTVVPGGISDEPSVTTSEPSTNSKSLLYNWTIYYLHILFFSHYPMTVKIFIISESLHLNYFK